MEVGLILSGQATLEDMYALAGVGYEVVIEDGKITNIIKE